MSSEPTRAQSGPAPSLREDRSIGDLFGELASETSTLVRHEIELAKIEMTHKATYAGKQATFVAAGGLLGVVSLLTLVGALVVGLGTIIALWLSALIVGVVIGAIAYGVAAKGIAALRKLDLKPQHTLHSLEENKSWAQRQIR
jgi:cytochrome c biogenesis protein CcdA